MKNFEDHKTLIKDLKQELLDADKRISEIEQQMDSVSFTQVLIKY